MIHDVSFKILISLNVKKSIVNHRCQNVHILKTRRSKPALTRVQKKHAGTGFVPLNLDLFTPKINGYPGLMVGHFCVTFGDPICCHFLDITRKNKQETDRQTPDRQTPLKTLPQRLPSS